MRVCQPGPPARKARSTSASRRMATCSLAGFRPGPRVRRIAAIVAATPPPGVTTAEDQSILTPLADPIGLVEWAAALEVRIVGLRFFAVGIAAGNQVCGIIVVWRPNQEDHPAAPQGKTLQPQFTVGGACIFHRDHGIVEGGLQPGKIDLVFAQIEATFRIVPSDQGTECICVLLIGQSVLESSSRIERYAASCGKTVFRTGELLITWRGKVRGQPKCMGEIWARQSRS